MAGIGTTGLILIAVVALLLFGPSKLPELGRAFGSTLKEFKNGTKDIFSEEDTKSTELESVQETLNDSTKIKDQ
jgi:sec-independent protein translocase protein TatA